MNGQPIEIISDVRPIDINRMVCLGFYIYDLQSLKTFKDMGAMLRVIKHKGNASSGSLKS